MTPQPSASAATSTATISALARAFMGRHRENHRCADASNFERRTAMPIDPEVLAIVVTALHAAADELECIDDGDEGLQDAIMPAGIMTTYREHQAMADVIRRIARAAPPERKRRLGEICRDAAIETDYPDIPPIRIPVMAEVRDQVADALEVVRRRALVDGDVRDALRELV